MDRLWTLVYLLNLEVKLQYFSCDIYDDFFNFCKNRFTSYSFFDLLYDKILPQHYVLRDNKRNFCL